MRVLLIPACLWGALVHAGEGNTNPVAQRLGEFKKLSEPFTKASTPEEVEKRLGKPLSTTSGAWSNPGREYWHYLHDTNEVRHIGFAVIFDPDSGCSVSWTEITREELRKSPLQVSSGEVIDVHRGYPSTGEPGFLCSVNFKDNERIVSRTIGVADLKRVKGIPEKGSMVRVEHHGAEANYIFTGRSALELESITFTPKTGE